jgi:hypothetical protein
MGQGDRSPEFQYQSRAILASDCGLLDGGGGCTYPNEPEAVRSATQSMRQGDYLLLRQGSTQQPAVGFIGLLEGLSQIGMNLARSETDADRREELAVDGTASDIVRNGSRSGRQ